MIDSSAVKLTRRKVLWGCAASAALVAGGYKVFRGFEDSPDEAQEIPARLRRAGLDIHVHALGVGAGNTGCWMSDAVRSSIQARAALWGLHLSLDQADLDQAYVSYVLQRVRSAGFLKQVVLLAIDWTHTETGERDPLRTPFYTPNDYVARLAHEHDEFLFGASIHPYRRDALDELDRVAAHGAVLVKWIPNIQAICLNDPRCRAFYRRLAQLKIALLPHVGDEQATAVAGQEYGDPRTLTAALEEGVTVIAAHAASLGERDGQSNFDLLAEMFPKWPNLYADTSALALITRWRMLLRLAQRSDLHPRLLHGSDFPLPPASTVFLGRMPMRRWWNAWKRENPLRRDFEIKQSLGLPEATYLRGYEVLAPRIPSASASLPR